MMKYSVTLSPEHTYVSIYIYSAILTEFSSDFLHNSVFGNFLNLRSVETSYSSVVCSPLIVYLLQMYVYKNGIYYGAADLCLADQGG